MISLTKPKLARLRGINTSNLEPQAEVIDSPSCNKLDDVNTFRHETSKPFA